MQDQNLDFYYIADLDDENILFGQAITDDEYDDKYFANHEPSLKNSNGEIVIPQNFYQLSGKEQIANSSELQDLALLVDKNTRIKEPLMPGRIIAEIAIAPDRNIKKFVFGVIEGVCKAIYDAIDRPITNESNTAMPIF